MEAVYLLFTDCCKRLKTGQELTALHAELEDILKSPLCWEMCMTVLCSPTALPDADRVYHHFVAAKMVHLLTAQDWTQLPRSLQDKIKKESLGVYFSSPSPAGSPDVAMLCRMCSAMLCRSPNDCIDSDCLQILITAASGLEKSIRAISLLKEVAVEISLYSTGSGDSSADVIVKYRNLMLGFTVAAGSRCMYLHRSVQSVQGALHPPHCNEIISSMSVLSASLECLLTWCDSVLSVATSGADIIAMDEEDGIRNRQLTTAADILEADARSEVHSVAHHLSAATAYCDIIDSVTVSSMLCEVLLPLVIGISSCCSGRQCEPAVATASWESTLYSLAASSAEHITSLLLCLFKPWTGRYLLDQSQKISSTAATGDAAAIAALAEVYGICHMGTIMVSSLAVFWESMLGIQARCFVKMASVWSLQGAGVSEKDFYAQVVTHLLGRDLHCRLLWSDQAVFSETHFKIPSPFLISLIELTIFICEKQSSLFFGSEDIFLKTRQNLRPHLLLGAADGDSGSSESEGAIVWLALIYALLILPDNRQAALLLSELLCYLQDSAPTELLAADPSSDTFNQTPRVISRLLIKHCTYDGCIDISRIVLAGLYRYGIRSEGCANGSDDETEELFHNINILRCDISVVMRSLCIYTKAGKDTILDTCSELVVSWQQLMSDISTEEKFACQPNGLLFRTLEAQMNLLYIVGDVVMNDYEQMSASAAPLQSSGFRSARTSYSQTASGRSPGGPCPTLRNWTMRWLSLALGASDAVAQFDQILSAKSDSNGYKSGYEDMKFVLRQKLSALWTAAPFFINSVYQCHDMAHRSATATCVLTMARLFLSDVNMSQLALMSGMTTTNYSIVSRSVALAEMALTALDCIVLTLYDIRELCDDEERESVVPCPAFTESGQMAELLQLCVGKQAMSNIIIFISGCRDSGMHLTSELLSLMLKVISRYYGLVGRLLASLYASSDDAGIKEQCTHFLKLQISELFNSLQTQAHTTFRLLWSYVFCLDPSCFSESDVTFRSDPLLAALQRLGLPFHLPFVYRFMFIGTNTLAESTLAEGITLCTSAFVGMRCICASLAGMQLGLGRSASLSRFWSTLVCQGGGYRLLLELLEQFYNLEIIGRNVVIFARHVILASPQDYTALQSTVCTHYPQFLFPARPITSSLKKHKYFLEKMERLFSTDGVQTSDDICNLIMELETNRGGDLLPSNDIYLQIINVASIAVGSNEEFSYLLFRSLNLGTEKAHQLFCEAPLITSALCRAFTAFLSTAVEDINALAAKSSSISADLAFAAAVECSQNRLLLVCRGLILIYRGVIYSGSALSLSFEKEPICITELDNWVRWLRDILSTSFRSFRRIFTIVPLDICLREVEFSTSLMKYSKHAHLLGLSSSSSFGVVEGNVSLISSFFIMVIVAFDVDIRAVIASLNCGGHQMTKVFQLLLSVMKEISDDKFIEINGNSSAFAPFNVLYLHYASSILTLMLRRQLLHREDGKLAYKAYIEIIDIFLQRIKLIFLGGSRLTALVEYIHVVCVNIWASISSDYTISFNCRVGFPHQCTSPMTGCQIRLCPSDLSSVVRNTLVSYLLRDCSAGERNSVNSSTSLKRNRDRLNELHEILSALNSFINNSSSICAMSPLLVWELKTDYF